MAYRAKTFCPGCGTDVIVYVDYNDLERGYVKFRCDECREEKTNSISGCFPSDKDEYREFIEGYNFYMNRKASINEERRELLSQARAIAAEKRQKRHWWQR